MMMLVALASTHQCGQGCVDCAAVNCDTGGCDMCMYVYCQLIAEVDSGQWGDGMKKFIIYLEDYESALDMASPCLW